VRALLGLDPADQVLPADLLQQSRVVGGHVPPDHPDHLVIIIASGHEPAFASDQPHSRASWPGSVPSVMPGCWRDLGVLRPGEDPDLRAASYRARWPAAGWPPAGPPGPAAVHLPGDQPSPLHSPGRAG